MRAARSTWVPWHTSILHDGVSWKGANAVGARCRISVTGQSRMSVGRGATLAEGANLVLNGGALDIGDRTFVGVGTIIVTREHIRIGHDVLIAEYVTIRDQDHSIGSGTLVSKSGFVTAPVTIGDNVWLGAKVTVTKGVCIGDNCIIGANSVVTRDIPANSVAAGNPARVLRSIGTTH